MRTARVGHTATRLRDGRVLLTGGTSQGRVVRSAEIYDPRSGRFTTTDSLTIRRHKHAAALLRDGRVTTRSGQRSSTTRRPGALREPVPSPFRAPLPRRHC